MSPSFLSPEKNKTKLIIFDFDGVLADSFDCVFPLIKASMGSIGLSLTKKQYLSFFIGNVHHGFRDFIKDKEKYLDFSKFRKENFDKYYKPNLFHGSINFLAEAEKRFTLTIASSNRRDNILKILKENNTHRVFSLILATTEYTKEGMTKEILNKFNARPQETFIITDTVGDIKVAKKMGIKTIAVTWGFHSAKTLKSAKPDYLVKDFKMLYKQLKAF